MTRFNFKEACLLDASGELGVAARKKFLRYIHENPAALREYEEIRQDFERLEGFALPEFSALQHHEISAYLKNVLSQTMRYRYVEKRAAQRQQLIRWALRSVASAAAALMLFAMVFPPTGISAQAQREQIARINAGVEHLAGIDRIATPYELAITDVEASIRQLQTESPTMAAVYDKNMGNLLDALAMEPVNLDDSVASDPLPAPPGSL